MKISDKDFDKLISVAMSQVPDDDDIELKTDEELSLDGNSTHEFSPAFEKQMKKLIRKSRKQQYNEYRPTGFHSKIRIAVLIAVLVCAATMFSVSAFRTSIINFIFSAGNDSSSFMFNEDGSAISPKFSKYLPTYMPKGFGVAAVQEVSSNNIYIQFVDGNDGFYDVQCDLRSTMLAIDTEDGEITELQINGADVTISERHDRITATYVTDNMFYLISGNISKDVIIQILESIPKV